VLIGIRENEARVELLGYSAPLYKTAIFTISAAMAGLAGCLFANWAEIVTPGVFSLGQSAEVIIWTIVGGLGTLVGPIVGAIVLGFLKLLLGQQTLIDNSLVLGAILILVVLLLPSGLLPALARWRARRERASVSRRQATARGGGAAIAETARERNVLDTRDLSMRFGGVQAVNNVNFSLADRELRCLIGPNGAGKSTFFKCLTGQIRLDHSHGRVFIRGQDVTGWRAYEIVRLGVGIKTQVPSVMNGLTVEENLWLSARRVGAASRRRRPSPRCCSRCRSSRSPAASSASSRTASASSSRSASCSRRAVAAAARRARRRHHRRRGRPARAHHPRGEPKATVVVVDHDMQFVRMLGGRVTVMHQGAILREGPVDEVLADAKVREVYIGSRAR
jgi:ABC-type uncharacterized transport system ATPase subunit